MNVTIEMIKEAIKNRQIDLLNEYSKYIEKSDLDTAIELYEKYLNKELDKKQVVYNAQIKIKSLKERNKVNSEGFFVCEFE
ncbi:hypothetical protein HERIO_1477 [Hepatospora eriocheir]|uniref:Uncharacterized protein n=1 Tax=Hepatospora eriocheir TaxID=1081669 RepID=A0A1X0QA65_9MICR|nr:hypothetical protein HERIO_1477 [Hepatospora eriocheir]